MNRDQFDAAIDHLRRQSPPLVLPYALAPGELPGGGVPTFTAATWRKYRWNPPGVPGYDNEEPDPAASAKPTWAMIQAALSPAQLAQAKQSALDEVSSICRAKITTIAYGVGSFDKEVLLRLRNGHHASQDRERDRLRALCTTRENAIESATTVAAVEGLIAPCRAADFWKPPPANPPSRSR